MLNILVITAAFMGIALIVSLAVWIRGLYTLIGGRCSFRGNILRGKHARIAGLFLFGQFLVGSAIYRGLFEVFHMGSGGAQHIPSRIAGNVVVTAVFVLVIVGSYVMAFKYAKAKKTQAETSADGATSKALEEGTIEARVDAAAKKTLEQRDDHPSKA